jgi:hypothetical protein
VLVVIIIPILDNSFFLPLFLLRLALLLLFEELLVFCFLYSEGKLEVSTGQLVLNTAQAGRARGREGCKECGRKGYTMGDGKWEM